MRRLTLLIAVFTTAALTGAASASSEGTLVVQNGVGIDSRTPVVTLSVRGAIIGQLDRGRIVIDDVNPNDGLTPVVAGYDTEPRELSDTATLYTGAKLRFRAVGGLSRIRIYGVGADLNVVGRGRVTLAGVVGRYSLNGTDFQAIPDFASTFSLQP